MRLVFATDLGQPLQQVAVISVGLFALSGSKQPTALKRIPSVAETHVQTETLEPGESHQPRRLEVQNDLEWLFRVQCVSAALAVSARHTHTLTSVSDACYLSHHYTPFAPP